MNRLKFIIAEESYIIRRGLSAVIEQFPVCKIKKEYTTAESLLQVHKDKPDVLLVSAALLQKAIEKIPDSQNINALQLTNHLLILAAGNPLGKSLQNIDYEEIIYLNESPKSISRKLQQFVSRIEPLHNNTNSDSQLSKREETILKHIAQGLTNKEVAEKLFISTHTVMTHRKNITKKLGIKTVSGLTVYAIINQLIDMEEVH